MESTPSATPKPKPSSKQNHWGLIGALLLLACVAGAAIVWGSRRVDPHVTFKVDRLSVSPDGQIKVVILHQDHGPNQCNHWLKIDKHKHKVGSTAKSMWNESTGMRTTNLFQTSDPSSVHLLVKEGISFTLKPGMKKTLFEFIPQGNDNKLARYIIEVLPHREMLSEKKP